MRKARTRVMLQCGFAICGFDLNCGCGLFDAKDFIWFATRGFEISELFIVIVRRHIVDRCCVVEVVWGDGDLGRFLETRVAWKVHAKARLQ